MSQYENPFFVTERIEPRYFCDRADELLRLTKSLTNVNGS